MGVDTELFAGGDPVGLRKQLPEREFLLLFVGRLVDKKGCGGLLEALTLLPPALRNRTTLWVVGDGDQRSQLEQTTNNLGLAEKVRFWGAISNQRLPQFYAAADLFVAPSIEAGSGDTEGQGVVILEAFAGRACVLTTRVGGIEAVVRDNVTGALLPPNRPRDLALTIEKLLNDPDLRARLVENAFREVKERYDWKRIAGEFESLYRTLANQPRRHSNPQY
jgi:glycosyltransferase involved in cell wall biosynthesis